MTPLVPCRATVGGEIILDRLPNKTIDRIVQAMRVPNPKFISMQRYGRWTGSEPEHVECAIEMPGGALHVPRGAVDLLKKHMALDGLVPAFTDLRTGGTPIEMVKTENAFRMRDYQAEAVKLFAAKKQGLVVFACGGGKSATGVQIVVENPVTTLVLVHTVDLADQWIEAFGRMGIDAGLLGNGKDERFRGVVVGLLKTTLGVLEKEPAWGRRFGTIIVDEVHHCACVQYQMALRLLPARNRLGLTATPYREDGLTNVMLWSFGSILIQRDTRQLIDAGHLTAAKIELVETAFTWSYAGPEKMKLAALDAAVATNAKRNFMISDRAVSEAERGETVLVLVRTVEHAKLLELLIVDGGIVARALTGKVAKNARKETIDDLRSGKLRVCIATSLADEGIDLPRLSCVILASPQRAKGTTVQRLGRLMRLFEGKAPKLVDYVDKLVPTLKSRADARRRVYRESGLLP